jgi:ATP-binding protein involved in chromosome partitioning
MFEKVKVPLLGVVENMSYLEAPDGSRQELFGAGGGEATAEQLGIPLLAQVPLDPELRIGGDRGIPITIGSPESTAAEAFIQLAQHLIDTKGAKE